MPKVVAADHLDQLAADQAEIEKLRDQLAGKIRARNRKVVAAVDDGYPQDRIAAAIHVGPTAVTKILSNPDNYSEPAA